MKKILFQLVLGTVAFALAGCVGFVQLGKPSNEEGRASVQYGKPTVPATSAVTPPVGRCAEFYPPTVTAIPQLAPFTDSQLEDSEYVAEVTALYAMHLRAYTITIKQQWAVAYEDYKRSCSRPAP